jgi:hypothetical protein
MRQKAGRLSRESHFVNTAQDMMYFRCFAERVIAVLKMHIKKEWEWNKGSQVDLWLR